MLVNDKVQALWQKQRKEKKSSYLSHLLFFAVYILTLWPISSSKHGTTDLEVGKRHKCPLAGWLQYSITIRELPLLKQMKCFALAENHRVHKIQQFTLGGPERVFLLVASKVVNGPVCVCNELLNLPLQNTSCM